MTEGPLSAPSGSGDGRDSGIQANRYALALALCEGQDAHVQMLEDRKTREGEMAKKLHGTQRRYEDEMRACKTAEEKADMADKSPAL